MARQHQNSPGGRPARSKAGDSPPGAGSIIGGSYDSDTPTTSKSGGKSGGKPKRGPGGKATDKPGGKASGKPGGRSSSKSTGRSSGKPTGRPSGKPTGKPGGKSSRTAGTSAGPPKRKRRPPTGGRRPARSTASGETQPGERLQKVLAAAGYGSRRQCEELILEGRVEIDRKVIDQLGTRVDLSSQKVTVDGEQLSRPRHRYFLVNKPKGVLSTSKDPAGRERVIDLVPDAQRVFTVGRLDKSSEGLILVTNDGELANQLTHPRYGVEKTYHVKVSGEPTREEMTQLRRGIHLAEGKAQVAGIRIKSKQKNSTILEMVLREGRNREIRRVLASLGHKVQRLERIAIGPVRLGDMPPGAHREMTREELKRLRQAVPQSAK